MRFSPLRTGHNARLRPVSRNGAARSGGAAHGAAMHAGFAIWRIAVHGQRSEEHTSELQSLMRISYAVFCLKKQKTKYSKGAEDRNITHVSYRHHKNKASITHLH